MNCGHNSEAVHILHPKKLFQSIDQDKKTATIDDYCLTLIGLQFYGQTSIPEKTDVSVKSGDNNLGTALQKLDQFLRNCTDFNVDKIQFFKLLQAVGDYRNKSSETCDECQERLKRDGERFLEIYKQRQVTSEVLGNRIYWGTRQQMLSGKVIADWIDVTYGPMDPIFGILLNPTTGRVGPSDSTIVHELLFDVNGRFAYHSAVHDAFGYLFTLHHIGPGYDYLQRKILNNDNIFAGQASGLTFWKKAVRKYIRKSRKTKIIRME